MFLVIHGKIIFKGIIVRSSLARLDTIVESVQMKITYHDKEGKIVIVSADLQEAMRVSRVIRDNIMEFA